MLNGLSNFFLQLVVPSTEFIITPPSDTKGIFAGGLLSGVGALLSYAFTALIVLWVILSIYAAYTIITSAGDPQKVEKGFTIVKNVWIGGTSLLLFFVALMLISIFAGFGSVYNWSLYLRQCGGSSGGYYFKEVLEDVEFDESIIEDAQVKAYCCDDGWKIVTGGGSVPADCELEGEFKK